MTLLYCDGFDDQLNAYEWSISNGSYGSSITYDTGRGGVGSCLKLQAQGGVSNAVGLRLTIPASSSIYVGFAIKFDSFPGADSDTYMSGVGFYGDSGTTHHMRLRCHSTGQVYIGNASNLSSGGVLANGSTLTTGTWYFFEVYMTVADSGGRFRLKINGITDIDYTGDTRNGGTVAAVDMISLQGNCYGAVSGYQYYDDFYVLDGNGSVNNAELGDVRVSTLYPSGNGNSSQWVGSDADSTDNYALVDEAGAPVLTDYVESNTTDNVDTYAFQDLTGTPTVFGVQIEALAQKSDVGARTLALVTRSGSTDYASSDSGLTVGGWTTVRQVREVDPATSTAWTYTGVNAAQFGVKARP